MNISHRAIYVWYRNVLSYQRYILSTFVASLGEPLMYLLAMGMGLGAYTGSINGMSYIQFIAPGLVVSACMNAATFECTFSAFSRMHVEKIYDSQMITPISVEDIVVGELLWGMTRSAFSGIVILIVITGFGLVQSPAVVLYPLLWLLVGFLFSAMALLMTSWAQNFDYFTFYLSLFVMPMFFFSGIFFPLDNFPPLMQWLANCLPLTHAVALSRAIVLGKFHAGLWLDFIFLLSWGSVFFVIALGQMKKRLIK